MKLIRMFIAFVVVSLCAGLGSAFNGQSVPNDIENKVVEKEEIVETNKIVDKTENVESTHETETSEEIHKGEETANSFSESKQTTTSNSTTEQSKNIQKNETPKPKQNTETSTKDSVSNNQTVEIHKEEPSSSEKETNVQPKINDSDIMHSITKGRTEFSDESQCYARGLYIQNKEMDSVLDWNELHPDDMKQPIIDNSICYPIVKDGQQYWYLHFKTTQGNKDDELKQLYK